MYSDAIVIAFLILVVVVYKAAKEIQLRNRIKYIDNYSFQDIEAKLSRHYNRLKKEEIDLIISGLRHFFKLKINNREYIYMPSRCVDYAWHEFILYSQQYKLFCDYVFGGYLHHIPEADVFSCHKEELVKRTWQVFCKFDNINPEVPDKLPVLYAIDNKLNIPDGIVYSIEKGIFPKVLTQLTPSEIIYFINCRGINFVRLAESIKSRIFDKGYCQTYGGSQMLKLGEKLKKMPELMNLVFDTQHYEKWVAEMKKVPEPVTCGS